MPIIRINNYIGASEYNSSDSEYSLSPIRIPYRNRTDLIFQTNYQDLESPSNYSSSPCSSISHNFENEEVSINIRQQDIENSLQNSEDICLICTDNFRDVCKLRCGHKICLNCLIKWFRQSRTCPFCREEINNINFNYLYPQNYPIDRYLDEEQMLNTNIENNQSLDFCRATERIVCYGSLLYWVFYIVSNHL